MVATGVAVASMLTSRLGPGSCEDTDRSLGPAVWPSGPAAGSCVEARHTIEQRRRECNEDRPQSSLGNLTAFEYAREHEPEEISETEVLTLDVV